MAGRSSVQIEIHSRTVCIVTLHGEHDLASSEQVTLALALARGYVNVLVDLTACSFLDVKVVNALLDAARRLSHAERSLELVVPPTAGSVRRLLDLTGVLRVTPLHATRSAGLAAIAASESLRPRESKPRLRGATANFSPAANWPGRVAKTSRGTTILRAAVTESAAVERPQAA